MPRVADIMADITDLIMEDIIAPTIMGLIVGVCVECTVVHIDGVITDTIGGTGAVKMIAAEGFVLLVSQQ
jgi:hypothetical protein